MKENKKYTMNIVRKTHATLLFINLNRLSPINIETYHMLHMMRTIIPLYRHSIQTGYNMHLTRKKTIEFLQVKWICGHKIASLFVLTYIYHEHTPRQVVKPNKDLYSISFLLQTLYLFENFCLMNCCGNWLNILMHTYSVQNTY